MKIKNLGLTKYSDALKLMDNLHAEVVSTPQHEGYLLVVEHPPTVTMGNRNNTHDLLLSPEGLRLKNIDYYKIDRGGSVTVHEPGQCVIYPTFNLFDYKLTVRSYVCALESAMIQTCAHYGITANRDPQNPGIWVGNNKIGAVGIRVHNKVTKHGIALNINNSLHTFAHIVPCGLRTKGVTNIANEIKRYTANPSPVMFSEVADFLTKQVVTHLKQIID